MKHAYYLAHKDEMLARARLWAKEHKERHREVTQQWRRLHATRVALLTAHNRRVNPLRTLLSAARSRAKAKGLECTITAADLTIPTVCPLLGILIDPFAPKKAFHPSLDRLDNTKGYVKGNVCVVSFRANHLKNDATAHELRTIADNLDRLLGAI